LDNKRQKKAVEYTNEAHRNKKKEALERDRIETKRREEREEKRGLRIKTVFASRHHLLEQLRVQWQWRDQRQRRTHQEQRAGPRHAQVRQVAAAVAAAVARLRLQLLWHLQ